MKRSLSIALFLLASVASAQPPQAPPVVDPPPQAPPVEDVKPVANRPTTVKEGVVYVNVKARGLAGVDTYAADSYEDDDTPRICLRINGKKLDVYPNSTDDGIQVRIAEMRGVSRSAVPFVQRQQYRAGEELRTADDKIPWPVGLSFPSEAKRYLPAKFTQAIATTNGAPSIDRVHRSQLKTEWQLPGGMEGVSGWRSDLFKFVPEGGLPAEWQMRLPVRNSFGFYQYELGNTRSYPDGTWFADLLSAGGKPFELRIREKRGDQWESYIAFKDADARPAGYHGLAKRCVECHGTSGISIPGTGGYAAGMISGADTIFSEPFESLEGR